MRKQGRLAASKLVHNIFDDDPLLILHPKCLPTASAV
jgi:hypothetical protein